MEACLHDAADNGYDGVELGRKFPREAHELLSKLSGHAYAAGVDYGEILRYSGWVVVEAEQGPAKTAPWIYTEKAYQYVQNLLF